jgi:exodeoxyribonuclease VII large subunit
MALLTTQTQTEHTVSSLTKAIRSVLETKFVDVTVEGEISNFVDHRSGHRYFTLKDAESQIPAVFWKTRALNFQPKDGMKVVCRGRVTVYPPQGKYQFDVLQMRPSGIGDLQQAYEALFRKLENEGLFDERRKRPIPRFPKTIGIVTSENGAALHDMLTVLRRRYPLVRVVLRAAAVQGVGAELEIARAIQEFNLAKNADLLIVGRGGGSLEDLWCFNEEAVARAIYASKIPVISAVGHEVDTTIADFVADLRAPTPTAAAELATPDCEELRNIIEASSRAVERTAERQLAMLRRELDALGDARTLRDAMRYNIRDQRETMLRNRQHVQRAVASTMQRLRLTLERDHARLAAMNPDKVLERGFTALESLEGEVIPRLASLIERDDKNAMLIFADGRISVRFD